MKYRCITRAELPAVGSREHALNEAATRADYFFRQTNGEYRFPAPDGQVSQLIEMLLAAANMPPETVAPAPDHSGDGNEMVAALRQYRHNDGGGFVFAYDKEQTDRIVTGLVKALEPFAKCARELDGSPEDGIDPADDDEWAKFRLLVSDYRRARAALAAHRKQGGEA